MNEELQALWDELREQFGGQLGSITPSERTQVDAIIASETNGQVGSLDALSQTIRVIRQQPNSSISQQDERINQAVASFDTPQAPQGGPSQVRSTPFPGLIPPTSLSDIEQGATTLAHGATLGGLDELVGAISAAGAVVPGGRSPGEAFTEGRQQTQDALQDFGGRNPGVSTALQVGGGLASGVGAPAALGALSGGGKLATFLRGLGVAVGEGTAAGALSAEPGERGAGAATGAAVGTAFGVGGPAAAAVGRGVRGGSKSLLGLIRRALTGKGKPRPTATSVKTAGEGVSALADEVLRPDNNIDPQTLMGNSFVNGSVAKMRASTPQFRLADHPAFADLAENADNVIQSTSVAERRGATAAVDLAEEVAGQAGVAAISPKLGAAKILGSHLLRGRAQRELTQNRATSKWLSDKLFSTNPKDIDEVLAFLGAALDEVVTGIPGRPTASAGFTGPAVQQLVESLDR